MRILIIKIGAIGDVIMSLPLVNLIIKENKENEITWVVGEASFPIISKVKGIKSLSINEKNLFEKGFYHKLFEVMLCWKKIGFYKRYDLILVAHSDPKYKLLALPFLPFSNYRSFYNSQFKHSNLIPGRHHTYEYLRLFHQNDSQNNVDISFPEIDFGKNKVIEKRQEITIAIAPGGAKTDFKDDKLRRWPIESYVQLASKLLENNYKVALVGGPSDLWALDYFKNLDIECQINKYRLIDSIFELKSMHCLVTHDCGPMHFSILAQIPVIAIFGPSNPYEKIPITNNSIFFWGGENLHCRPCYDGRFYSNCKDNLCMQTVKPNRIYEAICKVIGADL